MSEVMTLPNQIVNSTVGDLNLNQLETDWLILYFYPKDSTAGCTVQAVDFSQMQATFSALGATVVGVSRDSLKSHHNFIAKQSLTLPLVSDSDEYLCQYFDVIKEKNMYGKKVFGIERSTFIFYRGQLMKSYRKVKAKGHAEQVVQDLKQLQSN